MSTPDFSEIPTLFEMIEECRERPQDYFGAIPELQDQGWCVTFGRHRDSDNLDISNYETILETFSEKYELNEDYRVEGSSHWAVGWADQILVRALRCNCEDWEDADIDAFPGYKHWRCNTCDLEFGPERVHKIFFDCIEFKERLEEYPILDEDHHSNLEHEELMDWLESEVNATVNHLQNDEIIKEDYEPDTEKIFQYLFDKHSVSSVEDVKIEWIEEAILAIADQENAKL